MTRIFALPKHQNPGFASGWIRLGAALVDTVVTMVGAGLIVAPTVLMVIIGGLDPALLPPVMVLVGFLVVSLLPLANEIILPITRWQGTVGQRMVGIYITDRTGRKIGFFRCLARVTLLYLIFVLPALLLPEGILNETLQLLLLLGMTISIFFTRERLAVYDMLSGVRTHYGLPPEARPAGKQAPAAGKPARAKAKRPAAKGKKPTKRAGR